MSGDRVYTVGLVSCGKAKAAEPAPARELYTSALFRAAAGYAEATYDAWFVLSGLHCLVDPNEVLRPYDRSLGDMDKRERTSWGGRTVSMLQSQLRLAGMSVPTVMRPNPWPHPPEVAVYIHAGQLYAGALHWRLGSFPCEVHHPMRGLGIGQQLRWYRDRREAA